MEPFMGQLMLVSFDWPPQGFFQCDGQLLPINQYQALFSLLGTMYGGDGMRTFALPNLKGRTPLGLSPSYPQGSVGGFDSYALNQSNVTSHTHTLIASTTSDKDIPSGNLLGGGGSSIFGPPTNLAPMNGATVGSAGGSLPHENRQPYLCMNWVIAYNGIYPSRP
jgi:microcystin-dependent protein